jgi:hypothetical protein
MNIISGNDPFDQVIHGWSKYGNTVGYDYDRNLLAAFYGGYSNGTPFRGHEADNYIANIFMREPSVRWDSELSQFVGELAQSLNNLWRLIFIHCPIDVMIIRDGEIAASVFDNHAENYDPDVYIMTNENGEKDIIMPDDDSYQIVIAAIGDGSMDVSSALIGVNSPQTGVSEPKTYTIAKGQTYEINLETGTPVLLDEWSDPGSATQSGSGLSTATVPVTSLIGFGATVAVVAALIVITVMRKRKRRR